MLAALYVLLTLYDLLRSGMWAALFTLPQLLAVWLVYLVFFWDRIGDLLREFGFASAIRTPTRPSSSSPQ